MMLLILELLLTQLQNVFTTVALTRNGGDIGNNKKSGKGRLLFAFSETQDAGENWYFSEIALSTPTAMNEKWWVDFPTIGFCNDKITISTNLFSKDRKYKGVGIFVIDKKKLLSSPEENLSVYEHVWLHNKDNIEVEAYQTPAQVYDKDYKTQHLLSVRSRTEKLFYLYELNGTVNGADIHIDIHELRSEEGESWDVPPSASTTMVAPQPLRFKIHSGRDQIQNLIFTNNELYAVHSVFEKDNNKIISKIQVLQINANASYSMKKPWILSHDSHHYAYPSIAINKQGNIAVTMSVFSEEFQPSIGYSILRHSGSSSREFDPVKIFIKGKKDLVYFRDDGKRIRWEIIRQL